MSEIRSAHVIAARAQIEILERRGSDVPERLRKLASIDIDKLRASEENA